MLRLRLPELSGRTEKDQLQQLKRYLYMLVEELNVALSQLEDQIKEGNHGADQNR